MGYDYWDNAVSGNWNTNTNWSDNAPPTDSEFAYFEASGPDYWVVASTDQLIQLFTLNANVALTITGHKDDVTYFTTNYSNCSVSGKLRIGSWHGNAGATVVINPSQYLFQTDGIINVHAGGVLNARLLQYGGQLDVTGGTFDGYFYSPIDDYAGKLRIDGGVADIGSNYAVPIRFFGTGGGTVETQIQNGEVISGFSTTGNTKLILDGLGGETVRFKGTAKSGWLEFYKDHHYTSVYLRMKGDYLGATFKARTVGGSLVITASQNASPAFFAAPLSTIHLAQAMAGFGAGASGSAASPVASSPPLHSLIALPAQHNQNEKFAQG